MATYTLRADGTAGSLAAALDGDPAVASECLSLAGYASYGGGASPGDTFQLADDGGDYRGTLTIVESGTSGSEYTYENYPGDTPIINGADLVSTWTVYSGSVYEAALTTQPAQIWIDGNFGDRQTSEENCINEYDWYWASNVLYLYAPGDPDTEYTSPGVEASIRARCIDTNGAQYVDIDGITAQKTNQHGIDIFSSSYVTVKNCIAEWCWMVGINTYTSTTVTDIVVEDCTCRYNALHGIALAYTTGSISNWIVRRNETYENGKHQHAYPFWSPDQEFTAGIKAWTPLLTVSGWEIYENLCHDEGPLVGDWNTSSRGNGIWIDAVNGSDGDPIKIYHNLIYGCDGSGIFIEISNWNDVYCNVIYDCAISSWIDDAYAGGGIRVDTRIDFIVENINVYNNTISGCYIGLQCGAYAVGSCEFNDCSFKNNVSVDSGIKNLRAQYGPDNITYGSGNVYEKNCLGAESSNFIGWGGSSYSTYDSWISASSQTDNNIESDPSFTDAGSDDYTLASDSPCIGAAVDLGLPYNIGLLPASTWPDGVLTGDRDSY